MKIHVATGVGMLMLFTALAISVLLITSAVNNIDNLDMGRSIAAAGF